MAAADRLAPALAVLTRDGADPIVVDAAISSLQGLEAEALTKILQGSGLVGARDSGLGAREAKPAAAAAPAEAVAMLAAAVAKSGDVPAVQRAITVVADASQP